MGRNNVYKTAIFLKKLPQGKQIFNRYIIDNALYIGSDALLFEYINIIIKSRFVGNLKIEVLINNKNFTAIIDVYLCSLI